MAPQASEPVLVLRPPRQWSSNWSLEATRASGSDEEAAYVDKFHARQQGLLRQDALPPLLVYRICADGTAHAGQRCVGLQVCVQCARIMRDHLLLESVSSTI
jgi:hypothetical protein